MAELRRPSARRSRSIERTMNQDVSATEFCLRPALIGHKLPLRALPRLSRKRTYVSQGRRSQCVGFHTARGRSLQLDGVPTGIGRVTLSKMIDQ